MNVETYSLDFTIGESYAAALENSMHITQGFQQSWLVVTALDDSHSSLSEIIIYPNPTVGLMNIQGHADLVARLFDRNGQYLMETNIANGNDRMDLSHLPGGVYILVLKEMESGAEKSFRISKLE